MEIIDSHHHLWDPRKIHYSLFEKIPGLNHPSTIADYAAVADRNRITVSVCVEAASAGADGMAEARWLLEHTRASRLVQGLVLWGPVERPDLPSYLKQLKALDGPRIVGIRRSFEFEPPDFACRDDVIEGVRLLAEYGYPFDLVLFDQSLPAAVELVRACPQVQFVLDHLGKPRIRDRILDPWRRHLTDLASLPNVVCKVSGLTTEADRVAWTLKDLRPYLDHAVACFGWDRLLFGSDWPPCDLAGGCERWMGALGAFCQEATDAERGKFFAGNAARIYQLAQTVDS